MKKLYKRILTPLFFTIVSVVVLSCSAFADGESSVPYISINNGTPIPWISSVTFESGDVVNITSSGLLTFTVDIPSGCTFNINPNVTISKSASVPFNIRGTVNNYGSAIRSDGGGASTSATMSVQSGGVLNCYYGSIIRDNSSNGSAVRVLTGGTVNVYNGSIIGVDYSIYNESGSFVNVFNGEFEGNFLIPGNVNVQNGTLVTDPETGEITYKSNILSVVSDVISESISWITSFVSAITSNTILLVFVLVGFAFLGINLLRRVKSI